MLGRFSFTGACPLDESPAKKLPDPGAPNGQNGRRPVPLELHIKMDPATGDVEIIGPVDNRAACYSMLEMARASIDEVYIRQLIAESQPRIIPAAGPLPPLPPFRRT